MKTIPIFVIIFIFLYKISILLLVRLYSTLYYQETWTRTRKHKLWHDNSWKIKTL